MTTHVYVADTSKEWQEWGDGMHYVPCKFCGLPPGGEHRELESLVDDPDPQEDRS